MAVSVPRRTQPAHPPSLWWGVLALLAMPLIFAAMLYLGAWYWSATMPAEVQVPSVLNLDEQAAMTVLAERGLRPRVAARRYDEKHPAGKVLEVVPPVNRTVKQGRPVALVISKGSRWTTVPNLQEMSLEQARKLLVGAQLRLARVAEEYNEKVPAGYTISQRPQAGRRIERDSAVEVTVSKGPKPVAPPPSADDETGDVKYAQVEVNVPPGEFRHEVVITVEDDGGVREVYREWKDPGTHLTTTVQGTGEVTVRVLIDGQVVQEQTL